MDHDADVVGPQDAVASADGNEMEAAFKPRVFFHAALSNDSSGPRTQPATRPEFLDPYIEGQEDERRRMGRELHDSTAQLLLALRLSAAHLRHVQGIRDTEEVLSEIEDTARQIDQEIRTFSFLNYPAELGKCGLVGALETLATGFGKRTGIQIDFKSSCIRPCAGHLASALLRVAQEALMNIHRHAQATKARVALVEYDGILELRISDDGRGMPPANHHAVVNGVGIQGMRHRVERLGGRFTIRRLKHGTKLVASVPRIRPPTLRAA